jgi:signal transduction histidine kinase
MKKVHLPLRTYLVLLVLGTLVPLLVFATALALVNGRLQRTASDDELRETARALAVAVDKEVEQAVVALGALAASAHLTVADFAAFYGQSAEVLASLGGWENVILATPDGRQLTNLREPLGSPLPRLVEVGALAETLRTQRPAVSGFHYRAASGDPTVAVTVPVVRDGRLAYVLVATRHARTLQGIISPGERDSPRLATVYDRHGVVIARSRGDTIAGSLAPPTDGPPVGVTRVRNAEGVSHDMAWGTARGAGWRVVVAVPAAVTDAALRRSLYGVGAGALVAAALAVALAATLGRRLVADVADMGQVARALGHGESAGPVPTAAVRELEELGASLREAATLLHERQARIAQLLAREQAARREAETTSRAKDEFLAMLGHELRNPLNAIGTALAVLERVGGRQEPAVQARGIVRRQLDHLVGLLDDLLDVARVTSGKIHLTRAPLDLAQAVRRAVETIHAAGRGERHLLTLDLAPVWVDADETRMEQVVSNLLSNAVKYTPAGGAIQITVATELGEAVLRVSDTGQGMPAETRDRVFDLFFQGERSLDRSQGGLGIGLTLVRRLVEMHGGSVGAASEGPGRGSTFTVRLPRGASPVLVSPTRAATPSSRGGGGYRRVLVVEDNSDTREMLRQVLAMLGHEVHVAQDGAEAVDLALRLRPDVALVDVGLPALDGYAVARAIRAAPGGNRIRLVAVTGYGRAEDRRAAEVAGFDAHVVKPVSPEMLADIVVGVGGNARMAS